MRRPAPQTVAPFRLLLFSERPAVCAFFADLHLVLDIRSVSVDETSSESLDDVAVAVVDVALDSAVGIEVCLGLNRLRPELPVIALVCCPHSVTPWNIRTLLAGGVGAILDLSATRDEVSRTLNSVARGSSILHLQLRRGQRELLRDVLTGDDERSATQIRLLELVALGLPDREIGERLHLSPHTVKHHIDGLRSELRVRNRTELAAWAGRNGFYVADDKNRVPVVPVHLAAKP